MAKGIELATAYISIVPETTKVEDGIKKALKGVEKYGDTAGRGMGRRMGDQLADSVGRSGGEAGEKFADTFRRQVAGDGRRVASGLTGELESQSDRSGRTAGRKFSDSFERSADPRVKIDATAAGRDGGEDAGGSFAGGFSGAIAGLGARGGPIAAAIAAGGLAGIKLLGPQIGAAMESAVTKDLTQARLGVDEATAGRIGSAAAQAFVGNFGQSIAENMDTATAAIQSGLLSATADTGSIRRTIEQLTTVSTLLGEDIPSVARSASQAIKTGMAGDAAEALDLLTVAGQNGLNVSGDLLDTITEYGTQFRKLGLDGTDAMGLISQAVKNGARDTDVAADAIKEFSIRAVDGSKLTADSFAAIGLNADAMAAKFAQGGDTARAAFDQVLDAIRNIEDPVLRAQVAVGLFGTQAEDLGQALNHFDLSTVENEFGRVEGASQRAADTMTSNTLNEWQMAKNNLVNYANEIRAAWNMDEWFGTIPTAINDLLTNPPSLTPGAPGVPFTPGQTNPPGASSPGRSPLDTFAPTGSGPGFTIGSTPGLPRSGGGNSMPGSYGLPAGTNSGGYGGGGTQFPDWVNQIAEEFGIKPSTYPGHQSSNRNEPGYAPNPQGLNRGIDWTGPPQNLQRFSDYLKTIPQGMEQVIYQNPATGTTTEIAGGRIQPGYFSGDLGGHTDHVHTRQASPIPLPPRVGRSLTYDQGGWLPPGMTVANNATGKPELILTPEQIEELKKQGIDPNTLLHGQAKGAPPGPTPHEGTGKPPGPEQLLGFPGPVAPGRTEGYIPAAAGNTGTTGGGVAGSLINLGAEAAKGAIQAAADLGKMAASAAAAGATGGAGAAAGPAAGAGIQIGADIAKRGVDWAAEMGNIGVGALSEQLFPFGAPRWLSDVDPTGFMPQLGINPALTTTGEAAIEAIAQQSAVDPMTTTHGQGQGAPPGPQAPTLPQPPGIDFLNRAIQPGEPPVPPPTPAFVHVDTINATDAEDVSVQIAKRQRLEAMRFNGRP